MFPLSPPLTPVSQVREYQANGETQLLMRIKPYSTPQAGDTFGYYPGVSSGSSAIGAGPSGLLHPGGVAAGLGAAGGAGPGGSAPGGMGPANLTAVPAGWEPIRMSHQRNDLPKVGGHSQGAGVGWRGSARAGAGARRRARTLGIGEPSQPSLLDNAVARLGTTLGTGRLEEAVQQNSTQKHYKFAVTPNPSRSPVLTMRSHIQAARCFVLPVPG